MSRARSAPAAFYLGAGGISTLLASDDQLKADKLRTVDAAEAAEQPLLGSK